MGAEARRPLPRVSTPGPEPPSQKVFPTSTAPSSFALLTVFQRIFLWFLVPEECIVAEVQPGALTYLPSAQGQGVRLSWPWGAPHPQRSDANGVCTAHGCAPSPFVVSLQPREGQGSL